MLNEPTVRGAGVVFAKSSVEPDGGEYLKETINYPHWGRHILDLSVRQFGQRFEDDFPLLR